MAVGYTEGRGDANRTKGLLITATNVMNSTAIADCQGEEAGAVTPRSREANWLPDVRVRARIEDTLVDHCMRAPCCLLPDHHRSE